MKAFIANLEAERLSRKLNKSAFAKACGISPSAYTRWTTAKAAPTLELADKVATNLQMSLDFLVKGEGARRRDALADDEENLLNIAHMLGVNEAGLILSSHVFGEPNKSKGAARTRKASE